MKGYDVDFDLSINKPITLKGNAIFNIPSQYSGNDGHYFYVVRVRKWDGSAETEIANGTSTTVTWAGGVMNHAKCVTIKFAIPLTRYKKGETLRITLEGWGDSTGASYLATYHDPANRGTTGDLYSTKFISFIPVVIDL